MSERVIRLEACRGLAALVVVFHHIILGFEPTISGIQPGTRTADSLVGSVFFVLINGYAAVIFFFVLSGYVLTVRFFENPNLDYMVTAVLKRLPRLALLTTIVTLSSAAIWLLGLYHFREASELTGSSWLHDFASAHINPDTFQPSLIDAIMQGAWRTFIFGEFYYDSALWTMMHEFRGSIVVFIAAPFIVYVLRNKLAWLSLVFAFLIFRFAAPYMIPFICGMAIAYYRRRLLWSPSSVMTATLLLLGMYLLGFHVADRHYEIVAKLTFWIPAAANSFVFKILVQTTGAMCIIIAILQSPVAERILDNKVGAALGRLSFPIYLVHVPIILSASSAVYVGLFPFIGRSSIWGAAMCTLVLAIAISWPLGWLDVKWVRFLNDRIGRLSFGLDRLMKGRLIEAQATKGITRKN